jgi:hypothetical protein
VETTSTLARDSRRRRIRIAVVVVSVTVGVEEAFEGD